MDRVLIALPLLIAATGADRLPLTRGIFVVTTAPCKGASNAATMSYWGGSNALNSAQAKCTIRRTSHSGKNWMIARRCENLQGGDMGVYPVTLAIADTKNFTLDGTRYRWCGKKMQF